MTIETLSVKNLESSNLLETAQTLNFEEGLKRLEEIVARMEEGQISLEASVVLYEEGVALKKHLQDQLNQAKLRVEKVASTDERAESAT